MVENIIYKNLNWYFAAISRYSIIKACKQIHPTIQVKTRNQHARKSWFVLENIPSELYYKQTFRCNTPPILENIPLNIFSFHTQKIQFWNMKSKIM